MIDQMEHIFELHNGEDSIEGIKCFIDKSYVNMVYINGAPTDVKFYGYHTTPKEIYTGIVIGMSLYNRRFINNFFKEIMPEEFL